MFCLFYFKQKTAYVMRISDWSSDVCSSDLGHQVHHAVVLDLRAPLQLARRLAEVLARRVVVAVHAVASVRVGAAARRVAGRVQAEDLGAHGVGDVHRSEEHTSELQSLMRISYAVFCLKKKTKQSNAKHKRMIKTR